MMAFDVKEVREFLILTDEVFSLRQATRQAGYDTAYYHDGKNRIIVGKVRIFIYQRIISPLQLEPFVEKSGLYTGNRAEDAKRWFELAQKMHKHKPMNLYHIFLLSKSHDVSENQMKNANSHSTSEAQERIAKIK